MDFRVSPPATDAREAALPGSSTPCPERSLSLAVSLHQNILGLIDPRGKRGRAAMIWMKLLHQGPVGADDLRGARALRQTQDFVRLSARHRAPGPGAPPPLTLTLICVTPAGEPAV